MEAFPVILILSLQLQHRLADRSSTLMIPDLLPSYSQTMDPENPSGSDGKPSGLDFCQTSSLLSQSWKSDRTGEENDDGVLSSPLGSICDESLDSTIVVTGSAITGYAVLISSQKNTKRRASGFDTPLFLSPVTFEMIAEFYGPCMFRKSFRMSRSSFDLLLSKVKDLLERTYVSATEYRRETVPADIRLAITLRVLAGASYCDLSLAYQVKESTVFDIFTSTCKSLMVRLQLSGFPRTKLALQRIAQGFQTSRTDASPLYDCVGALDGICIKIKKPNPSELPASFYSRKGFYALPLQALCDSNYIFRYCSAICAGSTHDALAYAVSGLKKDIDNGILSECFYIAGDEAYTCTEKLITPFSRDSADYDQMNFSFFLSSMRIHIEQAFGMLVARWRILKGGLEYSVRKCTEMVCLLMKLHNFCLAHDRKESWKEGLTQTEKDQLEEDIKAWYQQSDELIEEFRQRNQNRRPQSTSGLGQARTKRDALVAIVKEKGRRMPNPLPLTVAADARR